jgi:hypothetical protein
MSYNINLVSNRKRNLAITKNVFLFFGIISFLMIISVLFLDNSDIKEAKNIATKAKPIAKKYELALDHPVFKGTNKYQLPYQIAAVSAHKTSENQYQLFNIEADYPSANYDIKIKSLSGLMSNIDNFLLLTNNVQISLSNILFLFDEVGINLTSQDAISDHRTKAILKHSEINSDSFKTENSGDLIIFTGNVKSSLDLNDFNTITKE